ncbi:hypothetical protein LPW11_18375 [Geomonas sp. RF6]|uniref:hypothetical protein n=1 Tax=Geomonas sp. RF6 TaxID=2897342 RepID=UPI001E5FD694|nr:hypothetical protein [Geomonas sp. RF6]UFS69842.1 hypothetical protein LPW11_18375 [Geomonas sp. RF6]
MQVDRDEQDGVPQETVEDWGPGLQKVRKRRLLLWILIAVYMPLMWIAQRLTHSFWDALPVFWVWFALLIVIMTYSALARCPRCGNYFHMNGMSLLYLRKCLHCQLHVCADKPGKKTSPAAS